MPLAGLGQSTVPRKILFEMLAIFQFFGGKCTILLNAFWSFE